MTGKKATKSKAKCKKSKKTTTPRVLGLYGVKITKGMNKRKARERESLEFVNSLGPSNMTGAEQRHFKRVISRIESRMGSRKEPAHYAGE
jgi:hypothetical protein